MIVNYDVWFVHVKVFDIFDFNINVENFEKEAEYFRSRSDIYIM
jgi:hypothetical protein